MPDGLFECTFFCVYTLYYNFKIAQLNQRISLKKITFQSTFNYCSQILHVKQGGKKTSFTSLNIKTYLYYQNKSQYTWLHRMNKLLNELQVRFWHIASLIGWLTDQGFRGAIHLLLVRSIVFLAFFFSFFFSLLFSTRVDCF